MKSIALTINQEFVDGRRSVDFDLTCLPEPEKDDDDFDLTATFSGVIIDLLFGGMDSVHLALHAASDEVTPSKDPALGVFLEMGDGMLEFNVSSIELVQRMDWLVEADVGNNSVLMKRLVKAIRLLGQAATLMDVDSEYKKMIKDILSHSKAVADYADIILRTVAGTASISGDSELIREECGDFEGSFNVQMKFVSTHENWSLLLGSETSFKGGPATPYQWRETFVVSNPAQNLLIFARWIREHALNDLANTLNAPSIAYFGYLGEKFAQTLVTVFEAMGDKQDDGSIAFVIARDAEGTLWVRNTRLCDIGSILYQKLKERARFW